ncbi:DNA adenine methylase [Microbacteriaceae bacterium 4G12]
MGMRYIGSKARVANEIMELVGPPTDEEHRFVDAFCGTGAVAQAAAALGWDVHLNDALLSSVVVASARLVGVEQVPFTELGGYARAVEELQAAAPVLGFIAREYSPLSAREAAAAEGVERRYFTVDNAAKIDAVRGRVEEWRAKGLLNDAEHHLLLADLLVAASKVANIAGTYGCFLRTWSSAAQRPLSLTPRQLAGHGARVTTSVGDVLNVPYSDGDVAYFDPPYTKRQYAAYYHISETIAVGDEPEVVGVTGLRPWKHLASDYCYRSRALRALEHLVMACPTSRAFLSYSSEGHVAREALEPLLANIGQLQVHELGRIGRYRPNVNATRRASVDEYLFEILRRDVTFEAVA